ncbi:HD domain-containing protein [Candidatus Beckwithbacteria bacterium]|nr:HD domain-containing protein [Candidatus Beckwithbacteria bacterium]
MTTASSELSTQEVGQENQWTETTIVKHYLDHNLPQQISSVIESVLDFGNEPELRNELARLVVQETRKYITDTKLSEEVKHIAHEFLDYGIETSPEILLHCLSVAFTARDFCMQVSQGLDFSPNQAFFACLVHDYGRFEKKVIELTTEGNSIWNGTLKKPRLKLSDPEWAMVTTHPQRGYEIIKTKAQQLGIEDDPTIQLALHSTLLHQRWFNPPEEIVEKNRSYPNNEILADLGFNPKEIPPIVLLSTLADVYCARLDPFRHFYQKPQSPEEAIAAMTDDLGTHFDPELGKAFLDWRSSF